MTPLQKNILAAVKRRPMTLRELQNNLQVDNSRPAHRCLRHGRHR